MAAVPGMDGQIHWQRVCTRLRVTAEDQVEATQVAGVGVQGQLMSWSDTTVDTLQPYLSRTYNCSLQQCRLRGGTLGSLPHSDLAPALCHKDTPWC